MDPVIYPHAAAQPYRSLEHRLLAVKVVFWLIVGVWLTAIAFSLLELSLASRWADDPNLSPSEFAAAEHRTTLIGWAQWLGWLAGAIVFIRWMYGAYRNVDAVAPGQRRFGYGWAIVGWFVPIWNFFRPKQVINDIWRAGGHPLEPAPVLLAWWLLGLFNNYVVENVARSRYGSADTPEEYRTAIYTYLVSDGLGVLTAILAIVVVTRLTRRLDQAAEASLRRESSSEAPTDAPSVSTITPSDTPTGR